jgi:hypothetical protein
MALIGYVTRTVRVPYEQLMRVRGLLITLAVAGSVAAPVSAFSPGHHPFRYGFRLSLTGPRTATASA